MIFRRAGLRLALLCVALVSAASLAASLAAKPLPKTSPLPAPRPEAVGEIAGLVPLEPPDPAFDIGTPGVRSAPTPAAPAAAPRGRGRGTQVPSELRALVARHAAENGVPVDVAHAVVMMESRYNARLSHAGAMGLMQIRTDTARSLGFKGGAAELLDADTNLRYGMRYLASAWRAAGGDLCGTLMRYQSGGRAVRMSPATIASCARVRDIMRGA